MAATAPSPSPTNATSLLHTTRRGISTASFCLGLWGLVTFAIYPFGFFISNIAIALAITSIVMGFRAGAKGEQMAWWGLFFGMSGAGGAVTIYRVYQVIFEGSIPTTL
jgi:hypothetical protein